MPAAFFSPMTVNAASAARNWVTGSSLPWPSKLPFLTEAQNSHAVNNTRSARETLADPVAAVVITSSNRALVAGLCPSQPWPAFFLGKWHLDAVPGKQPE